MFEWIRNSRRQQHVRQQWPAALVFVSGALKAGLPVAQAVEALVAEAPEPLYSILGKRSKVISAWMPWSRRVQILFSGSDLALARAALILTQTTGGRTADILDRAAQTLQMKIELEDRARALSAQARASAWVVGLTPGGLLLLFALLAPSYISPLFTERWGWVVMVIATVMILVGLVLVRRLARVDL